MIHKPNDSKIKNLVVITVPHGFCEKNIPKTPDQFEHYCDTYGNNLADKLYGTLKNKYNIVIFKGDINRKIMDLNRIESRHTKFRTSILHKIIDFAIENIFNKNIIYLLDCHSYPATKPYSFSNISIQNPEVSLLFDDMKYLMFVDELVQILRKNGLVTTMHFGIYNDIMDEVLGIQLVNTVIVPILVEVREDLGDDKIGKIAKSIEEWIGIVNQYFMEQRI